MRPHALFVRVRRSVLVRALGAAVALAMLASPVAAEDWTLAHDENGITVHTRPVEGSGIAEFKGEAIIEAPVSAISDLLRDSDRLKTWFPNTPESKLLTRDGNVSVQYSVLGTPWPMSDRDNVLRSTRTVDEATGTITIVLEADPDSHPEQSGRVRVRRANGKWTLVPRGANQSHVTFQMHLEPGGGIPEWMINARVVETPFEALTNMREKVAR